MKKYIVLFLKGLIVGIGKILPGISGSVLAISLNIYEEVLDRISNFHKNIKENILYLVPIFLGFVISIWIFSHYLLFIYKKYSFFLISIVIGIVIGTIPSLISKIKNWKSLWVIIFPVIFLSLPKLDLSNFKINLYILIGFIESITTILPGISGSAIYMNMHLYDLYLNIFTTFNLNSIIFLISLGLSSIFIIKLVNYLFKKYKDEMYILIIFFLIHTIFMMFKQVEYNNFTDIFIFLLIGLVISLLTNK